MTTPLNNKKGTTLVELMVCLVLLALFGTAAVTLVKPCAEAYIEVQQLTRAQNLADALTETIRGELADADGTISIVNAATESDADSADADSANNIFIEDARLTEGTALAGESLARPLKVSRYSTASGNVLSQNCCTRVMASPPVFCE